MRNCLNNRNLIGCLALLFVCFVGSGCATSPESSGRFLVDEMGSLELGDSVGDMFSISDPVNPRDGSPYRTYEVDLENGDVFGVTVESSDVDPGIALFAPDGTIVGVTGSEVYGEGQRTLVRRVARSGSHLLVVSGGSGGTYGSYRISTEVVDDPQELAVPSQVENILFSDGSTRPNSDAPMRVHPLHLEEDTNVEVQLDSQAFDAYLLIADANGGAVIAENDDWDGTHNSRVVANLPAGDYEVWVSAFASGFEGDYSLRVAEATGTGTGLSGVGQGGGGSIEGEPIEFDETVEGQLSQQSAQHPMRQTVVTYYEFEIEESMDVRVDLRSHDFDAYLLLEDSQGGVIVENDDAEPPSTDSQIIHHLSPGTYRIGVTTFAPDTFGNFLLEVRRAAPSGQSV